MDNDNPECKPFNGEVTEPYQTTTYLTIVSSKLGGEYSVLSK